ncbi:DUF1707 SHOCT-like domain-containing protein [Nocardioides currus]|uniref:DUF1707 domain-containing protein n=1 Tax=Nocardioides currus TaxID=2133958 RepID=A0A2R7Z106_9ACTN|nr:DUF1707 domain-containing protein [Nocardioides currus]PUA81936.1 hypothetical protein C7S10_07800 [Nocardioides currus]
MEPRIGDAERDVAAARLGDHFAAGRLDHEEYDERLDAIWSARTHADLDQVFWDMPLVSTPRPAPPVAVNRSRDVRFPVWMIAVAAIVLMAVAHVPWFVWLILLVVVLKRPWARGHRAAWRHSTGHHPGWGR